MEPPGAPATPARTTRVAARAPHALAVAAMLVSCVLPWATVSEGNGERVRYGWDFSYTDQVVGLDRVWLAKVRYRTDVVAPSRERRLLSPTRYSQRTLMGSAQRASPKGRDSAPA